VFLELAGVVAIAFLASTLVCSVIVAAGPVDRPNEERKLHALPTRTSGGLGIGAGFAAGVLALSAFSIVWRREVSDHGVALIWTSAIFAYPLLALGFIDDARPLSARLKFVLYAALALGAAAALGVVQTFPLGADASLRLPFAVGLFGTALWVFTMLNAVNFMDGANGLAVGSVAIGLLALALISLDREAPSGAAVALCGAGAMMGFLIWNFPNGRLFAGDSGALFAGAIAAFASLIVIARTGLSPFVPAIIFLPLLADVLLTLLFRVRRRSPLLIGHAEHLYQLGVCGGLSHARVAAAYWTAMAACGAAGVLAARDASQVAPWVALAALAGLAIAADFVVRGWAAARGLLRPHSRD
jgi:UDP-N-acetylmuramyl pentapeptide phosphotransferase/UDP-N-acetylglucosamine-1-phosphate transferase